ncbi:hypothetical protein MMC28_007179 [Mycoblastus sanguinarius]|nr:hypothetical protein [Mycoblastus sanguinarius]
MAPREGVASKQVLPNAARKMAGPQEKAAEKPAQTPAQVSKKMSKISKVPIRSLISERKCKFMRKINRERAGRELLRYTYIIKLNRKASFTPIRIIRSYRETAGILATSEAHRVYHVEEGAREEAKIDHKQTVEAGIK